MLKLVENRRTNSGVHYRSGYDVRKEMLNNVHHIAMDSSKNWQVISDEDGIVVASTLLDDELVCVKAYGTINAPPEFVYNLVYYIEDQLEWDVLLAESKVLESFDSLNAIVYMSFASAFPGDKAREFLMYRCCGKIDSDLMIVFRSIEHEKYPCRSDRTRCECILSGYMFQPVEGETARTNLIYIQIVDLKLDMSNPHSISIDATGAFSGRLIAGLRKYIYTKQASSTINRSLTNYQDELSLIKEAINGLDMSKKTDWVSQFSSSAVEILTRKSPATIMCRGYFFCNCEPLTVFDTLSNKPDCDLFFKNPTNIDAPGDSVKVILFNNSVWSVTNRSEACLLLMGSSLLNCVIYKSANHNNAPESENSTRLNVHTVSYFIHPCKENLCLVTYNLQLDNPYREEEGTFSEILPIVGARVIANINYLQEICANNGVPPSSLYQETKNRLMDSSLLQVLLNDDGNGKDENWSEIIDTISLLLHKEQSEILQLDKQLAYKAVNTSSSEDSMLIPESILSAESSQAVSLAKRRKTENPEERPVLFYVNDITWKSPSTASGKPFVFLESTSGAVRLLHTASIMSLDDEIVMYILSFLDAKDLCRLARVSKRVQQIAVKDELWERLYRDRWQQANENISQDAISDWKQAYTEKSIINRNWVLGKYKVSSLIGHKNSVRSIQFNDDYIISGSSDRHVKLWSRKDNGCIKTWAGPNAGVVSVSLHGDKVKTGYRNGLVRVFDLSNHDSVSDIQLNSTSTEGFQFIDNKVLCWDMSVEIWNLDTVKLEKTLAIHDRRINAVEVGPVMSQRIITGSADKTIKIWDAETGRCSNSYTGHTGGILCLQLIDNDLILSGSNDKTLRLIDIRSSECVRTYRGHVGPVRASKYRSGKIVSGSADSSVRIWDFGTAKSISTLELHSSSVLCVDFDEATLISGSSDGEVKKLTFNENL